MGFIFGGEKKQKVCYISDISRMPPESLALIRAQGPLELLVLDALALGFEHPTHFSVEQAVALCRELRPRRALLVGMGSQGPHDATNALLRRLLLEGEGGLDVQLAYDGMVCEVDL
jgi:phosphoribosyl 1,2-cyclic phosphate phosphodiesterase